MKKIRQNFGNVFYLLKPWWKHGKLYFLVNLLINMVVQPLYTVATVMLTQETINSIEQGGSLQDVLLTVLFYSGMIIVMFSVQSITASLYTNPEQMRITNKINREIYVQAIKTDYQYFDNPEFYNNFTWAVNEYASQSSNAMSTVMNAVQALATIASMTAMVAVTGPWIIIIVVAFLFAQFFIQMKNNKLIVELNEAQLKPRRRMSYLHRIFYLRDNAGDIKSTRVGGLLLRDYDESSGETVGISRRFGIKMLPWNLMNVGLARLNNAAVIAYVAVGVVRGSILGVGAVAGLVTASNTLSGGIYQFFLIFNDANRLSLYADKVRKFFDLESVIEAVQSERKVPEGSLSVELRDVSFGYPNTNFALKNISLTIEPGQKIAIVGENGAGKTTLAKLLLRLYDTDSGEILINGEPLTGYDVQSLRKRVGVAFQTTNLYAMPLADNMRVYRDAEDGRLHEIVEKIGLTNVLEKTGGNLHTELTKEFADDGVMLSGGEAQKLGLARLFTGDFGLLLLDEPSSALDPLAEYELTKLLLDRANTATTVMIAHRLSTIRDADMIYLVDNGEITERGTHGELIALGGKYYEMFTKQAENYVKT